MNLLAKISLSGALVTVMTLAISWLVHSGTAGTRVEGVVHLDGAPLPDVDVFFVGSDGNAITRSVTGHTDDNGRYVLVKPLEPGRYRVFLRGFVGGNASSVLPGMGSDGVDAGQLAVAMSARQRSGSNRRLSRQQTADLPRPLPAEWSSLRFSKLAITISESGRHVANIELNTDDLAGGQRRNRIANAR